MGKVLGSGSFGVVRLAVAKNLPDGKKFAVKLLDKKEVSKEIDFLKREIEFLRTLDHPNIIRLYNVYEDPAYFYIVMEFCSGGELHDRMVKAGQVSEAASAIILKKVMLAVQVLHSNGIAHRDLKPSNFMFLTPEEDAEIKLIDFGLSQKYSEKGHKKAMGSLVGTPYYVAPEVIRGKYGPECDVWSIGIMMYCMLSGKVPFTGETQQEILKKIVQKDVSNNIRNWKKITREGKELCMMLLTKVVSQRITLKRALKHSWFDLAPTETIDINPEIISGMRFQKFASSFQKTAMSVLVKHLGEEELHELNKVFIQLDTNQTGTLTPDEIKLAFIQQGINPAAEEIDAMIQNSDQAGNGEINYSEFIAVVIQSKRALNDQELWNVFKYFDTDDTMKISEDNLHEVMQRAGKTMSKEEIHKMIDEVDIERDGTISFEEFKLLMNSRDKTLPYSIPTL